MKQTVLVNFLQSRGSDQKIFLQSSRRSSTMSYPSPRGAGFWAWRPHILKETLNKMNTGEFLVYLDAGCKLNPLGKKRFHEYIDQLDESEYGFLSFAMSGGTGPGSLEPERNYSVKEVFKYFSVDMESDFAKSGQYLGGVLILQKNEHAIKTVELFLKALEDDPLMFSGSLQYQATRELFS